MEFESIWSRHCGNFINSRGGNYLLNIGPDGNGNVPARSLEILDTMGSYVKANEDGLPPPGPAAAPGGGRRWRDNWTMKSTSSKA